MNETQKNANIISWVLMMSERKAKAHLASILIEIKDAGMMESEWLEEISERIKENN